MPIAAPLVLDGWYVLHQFFNLAPLGLHGDDPEDRHHRAEALARRLEEWSDMGDEGWSGLYRIVGGGTDYMVIHFRDSLDALGEAERELRTSVAGSDLIPAADYLSVVELGLYQHTVGLLQRAREEGVEVGSETWQAWIDEALEQERAKAYVKKRLRPRQPDDMPYVCFYPMSKRRNPGQNWYTVDVEERARMMLEHGGTGRRYAGKVSQVITGSVGFDDWEWAVTLFSGDPIHFKNLVTEMRYDEVTAEYGEFGSFWVGHRIPVDGVVEELTG
jgi:hydrogen peroxide-dependent heme synthase